MIVLIAMLIPASARADAADSTVAHNTWSFEFTPYLFMAGLDGDIGIGLVNTTIDVPFSKILDHLDLGLMGNLEARKGRWALGLDAMYIDLSGVASQSVTGPFGRVDIEGAVEASTIEQIYEAWGGYRLIDDKLKLDAFVGARYTSIESELYIATTTTAVVFPGGSRTIGGEFTWWDPVLGSRTTVPVSEEVAVVAIFDVGGFGIGSNLSLQWLLAARWQFSNRFSAKVGYRYLYQDYEEDNIEWDMTTAGPIVGVGVRF